MACSTVLAAGAATGAVAFWPAPVAARQATGIQADAIGQSASAGQSGTSQSGATGQPPIGQAITAFETRHAKTQTAVALRAARARAAERARAAQRRAAELAAQRQAASQAAASQAAASQTATASQAAPPPAASGSPQQIAESMLGSFGWSSSQFSCLDQLWERESGWNPAADNPSSGAYGIPQALPGSKMASAGPDWQTSAATQIKWGLGYIQGTYGSPCAAWSHEETAGWY